MLFFEVEKFPDPIIGSPDGVMGSLLSTIGAFSPIL